MTNALDLPALAPDVEWITDSTRVHKFSQDFNWYSPVLKRQLEHLSAQVVARPKTQEQIAQVVSLCSMHQIPLTLRGTGTGNYGQCVPLQGGVVMDLSAYNQFLGLKDGVARAQSGIRLIDLDKHTKPLGFELRWIPSTFRSATLGGLYGGGFGGAGSITYGPIAAPGNVISIKVMSMGVKPQVHTYYGQEALLFHHTYGTNGIVLELEVAMAPSTDWSEFLVVFDSFENALMFANALSVGAGFIKKEVALIASPIVGYFTALKEHLPPNHHAVVACVSAQSVEGLKELSKLHAGRVTYEKTAQEVQASQRTLIEYTWNHTTLHALKVDKTLTYIQTGFDPQRYLQQAKELEALLSPEVMVHLEFIRTKEGLVNCSGLQIIRYTSDERLQEIMQIHRDHGVQINNPHVYTVEDGKAGGQLNPGILSTKSQLDPMGLLNPGKLRTWTREPS
jgi:FAD/FMN-containing dehydrogenase